MKLNNPTLDTYLFLLSEKTKEFDEPEFLKRISLMKNKYLAQHKNKIWQGTDTDKRWKTHLPPDNRLLRKKTKEELETAIIAYYSGYENELKKGKRTMKSTFDEWFAEKKANCTASGTAKRILNDWNKYYLNSDIINIPLDELTESNITKWVKRLIITEKLTRKQYGNLFTITKQMLTYCVENEYIKTNPTTKIKLQNVKFRAPSLQTTDTEVFSEAEQSLLIKTANDLFIKTSDALVLSIEFLFLTGLRVGELVALKYSDVHNNCLTIVRMEQREYEVSSDGEWIQSYNITEGMTKTTASTRVIPLVPRALKIIDLIKTTNQAKGIEDNDFIFINQNGRVHCRAITCQLSKLCKTCGITEKSPHKIRKTYATRLFDKGVKASMIQQLMGHTNFSTTMRYYVFSSTSQREMLDTLVNALSS